MAACVSLAWTVRRVGWSTLVPITLHPDPELLGADASVLQRPGPGRLVALAACVALPVVALAAATSTSGFVAEDIRAFRQAQVEGLSGAFLLDTGSGQWAPAHRFGDWLLQRLFPFDFSAAQLLLLVGFAASLLVLHRLLAELFRPGVAPLVLTLLYGASAVHAGVIQSWHAGLDRVPAAFFTFVSVLAYVRVYRTGSGRWLVVSVSALAAGLLFSAKPVLVPLYLVLLRVLVLERQRPVGEAAPRAARDWRTWLIYAIPVALYAYVYLTTVSVEWPAVADLGRYVGRVWLDVAVPDLFGSIGALAIQAVLAGLVIVSIRRNRGAAARAWAFFVATVLANAVAVGLTQLGTTSPQSLAGAVAHQAEIPFLLVLALGAAFLPVRGSDAARAAAFSTGVRVAVAVAAAAYLALSVAAMVRLNDADVWAGRRARAYFDSVEESLAARRNVVLVDGLVPAAVVPARLTPYDGHSEVLPLVADDVTFDTARGRDLFEVGPDGRLRRMAFSRLAGGDIASLLTEGLLEADGECGETFTVTPRTPVTADGLYVRLQFSTLEPTDMAIWADGSGRIVRIAPGERQTVYATGVDAAGALSLTVPPGRSICVQRLELGRLIPRL